MLCFFCEFRWILKSQKIRWVTFSSLTTRKRRSNTGRVPITTKPSRSRSSSWRTLRRAPPRKLRMQTGTSRCKISRWELSTSCQSMLSRGLTKETTPSKSNWLEVCLKGSLLPTLTNMWFFSRGSSLYLPWWPSKARRRAPKVLLLALKTSLKASRMKQSCYFQRSVV